MTEEVYWYEKNLQGDIVAVYDDNGIMLVSYVYDAWGNFSIDYYNNGEATSATKNNITYRGYYYDKDLRMYYLQTRYYDANIGRFINSDGYVSTGQGLLGYNMFAYCGNNPVMRVDPNGECSRFLGFLWKVDCKDITCPDSRYYITEDDINLYSDTNGARQEGKINVKFNPGNPEDENNNPSFQIENSKSIHNEDVKKFILNYITESDFYDEEIYGRTQESMLIEWWSHNTLYFISFVPRLADTDFDKNQEGWKKIDYFKYAIEEALNGR